MSKKILIIEDDKIMHQVIKDFLRDEHYDLSSAFNAQEAKRLLNTEAFDLIILDLVLPD
jgi:DNA-binding response OmpR family regulator